MKPHKAGIHLLGKQDRCASKADSAERLQMLGLMAAGVAHDFNNLLGVILGYCERLTGLQELAEPMRTMVTEISHAGTAARQLTRTLLAASAGEPPPAIPVDLNESVQRMRQTLQRMLGEGIVWRQELGNGLGMIAMQPGQVEQILMNLAINARDAMPGGGTILIETSNVWLEQASLQAHPGALPGAYVRLTVSDTGIGMDGETQARLFEPFFTTRSSGQGTGIGLSTVWGIVENCGGTIAVRSQPGKGSTFSVYLPSVTPGLQGPLPRGRVSLATACGTVLLVEDLASLRTLTRRILEEAGYRVMEAGDAAEALRLAHTFAEPIPLLITDVAMPGLSGFDLALRLKAMWPQTRVLFLSGNGSGRHHEVVGLRMPCALLEKPFTREMLVKAAGALLASAEHESSSRVPPASAAMADLPIHKSPLAYR